MSFKKGVSMKIVRTKFVVEVFEASSIEAVMDDVRRVEPFAVLDALDYLPPDANGNNGVRLTFALSQEEKS